MTTTAYTTRGSPPHTRDKSSSGIAYGLFIRIIPAYAGQIIFGHFMPTPHQDHPRIRGTNCGILSSLVPFPGSSPHTRDKYMDFVLGYVYLRIIPAYAGQIMNAYISKAYSRDHPRIRGTNRRNPHRGYGLVGSSPHTRDKFPRIKVIIIIIRIIPAYAGQIHHPNH